MKKVFSLVLAISVMVTIGLTTTMGVGALSFDYSNNGIIVVDPVYSEIPNKKAPATRLIR